MTAVLPNPYSPYADADPLYRHTFPVLLPSLFGEPKAGSLTVTSCERLAVVPDEPLQDMNDGDRVLPAGLCPACISAMHGDRPAPATARECQRCESTTQHNGLCAQCRQEQHADWWQASDTYARPFRLVLPDKRVLDGARFPNGQAVVIDDPEAGLSTGAANVEQLLASYHRAEVIWSADVVRVATARMQHAVTLYAVTAVEREDARREQARYEAAVARAHALSTQWAVLRTYGSAATELRAALADPTPSPLPAGFRAEAVVAVKCAACEYEFDESETYTAFFESVEQAHKVLRDHGWTVLDDGRALCDADDEEHQELRRTAAAVDQDS